MAERIYPRHEGFLYKRRRGPVARWRLCFLVTENGTLACFPARPTAEEIASARKRVHLPSVELSVHPSGVRFQLQGPHCHMELRGETKVEAETWISILRQVISLSVRRIDITMSTTDAHTPPDVVSNYTSPTQSPSVDHYRQLSNDGFSVELSQQNLEYEICRLTQLIQSIGNEPTANRLQELKDASEMTLIRSKELYGILSTTCRKLATAKSNSPLSCRLNSAMNHSSPPTDLITRSFMSDFRNPTRPALLEALREENEELRRQICELQNASIETGRNHLQNRFQTNSDIESTVYDDAASRLYEDPSDREIENSSTESDHSVCLTHNYETALKTVHHTGDTYKHTPVQPPRQALSQKREYRKALPCTDYPLFLSLIDFLKSHASHELPKVILPITVHMPLTLLQVMCEDLEFSEVLESASTRERPLDRMLFICAFAVSNYARSGKRLELRPFKPYHGETFEYQDPDKGIHFVAEQAQASPSVSVCHAFSRDWTFERVG